MDIATILGYFVGAFFVLIVGIGPANMMTFWDTTSVAIVFGGGVAATVISMPLEWVMSVHKPTMFVFKFESPQPKKMIKSMVEYAEIARRDGILALENVTDTITDDYLVKGIQLAVDGTDPELIENIMNTELDQIDKRHSDGRKFWELFTKYAPAWGMIGTLIGLINMLSGGMGDPEALTSGMAVALITTMYGSIIANYLTGPIADKLTIRNEEEMMLKNIILRGVMSIQSGDNPRIVEQKLMIYLPPAERDKEEE